MNLRRATVVLLFLPSAMLAQQVARGPTRIPSALSGVNLGTTIRASSRSGNHSVGKLIRVDSTAVWLELEYELAPVLMIRLPTIDTLWVQQRSTGRGIAIGGLVSAAALSVWACQPSCAESGVLWPGLVISPIPGIIIGAIVGHNILRWSRLFP